MERGRLCGRKKYMAETKKEKIKKIIEEGNSFAIILDDEPKEYVLLAALALKRALEEKGKDGYLNIEIPRDFLEKWQDIISKAKEESFSPSLSISIPKKFKIKELSYEEKGDFFTLKFLFDSQAPAKEDFIIKPDSLKIDAFFFIDFPKERRTKEIKIAARVRKEICRLPFSASGRASVSLNRDGRPFAEKAFKLSRLILEQPPAETATLLLASLLTEKAEGDSFKERDSVVELENLLVSLGADRQKIFDILKNHLPLEKLPIL